MDRPDDDEVLVCGEAWTEFLRYEVDATCDAYLSKPAFLARDARAERQMSADYADRELLELVQNAADASSEAGEKGAVLIEVTEDTLFVANTGKPFRKGGVRSLMVAHTSDKPTRAARMIGAKGLGFRAILNWTETPIVSSGALEIGFAKQHASSMVAQLAEQNAEIAHSVDAGLSGHPPLLAFPATGAELEGLHDADFTAALEKTRALRAEGFDTVIAAPFRCGRSRERAITQSEAFEPTFLLFVPALECIRLKLPGRPEKRWTKSDDGSGDVTLTLKDGETFESQAWILRRRTGSVENGAETRDYELAIALRTDEPNSSGKLHSFFPTSLPLPFSGLFHATLELNSSRKTIKDGSDLNVAVLKALGQMHAEMLDELRKSERLPSALSWLSPHQQFPEELEPLCEATWTRARTLPLVHCMDNSWRTPETAKIGPKAYAEYLPEHLFGQLARAEGPSDEKVLRDHLRVMQMPERTVINTLRDAELTLNERAQAIAGIAENLPDEFHDTRLLTDLNGKPMPLTATAYPPPAETSRRFSLPAWANARFIQPELWSALQTVQGTTLRGRIRSLQSFHVVEYSADAVMDALRRRAAELLKKNRSDPDKLQTELLAAVRALHSPESVRSPSGISVRCKDGEWRDVAAVHLSEGYGAEGRINAALLATQPGELVAAPEVNGLERDGAREFLLWLGINPWPRAVTQPLPQRWQHMVEDALPEEFLVTDGYTTQKIDTDYLSWGYQLRAQHETIYGIDEILEQAPSDAILAWIAHDPRLDLLTPSEPFHVLLEARQNGNSKFRRYEGQLPDVVRLTIETTPWLTCEDGRRRAPHDSMIDPGMHAALFPRPRRPEVEVLEQFDLSDGMLLRGLERAGVARSFSELPEPQVYRVLASLPDRDVKPEVASRLFLQVIERESFDPERGGAERDSFLEHGMLPVLEDGQAVWAARNGVRYALRDTIPEAAKRHLRLIHLPPRRNAQRVNACFGIAPIRKDELSMRLHNVQEANETYALQIRTPFARALPFIKARRRESSTDPAVVRRLETAHLTVATSAELSFSIGGQTVHERLDPWRYSLERDHLVVTIDETQSLDEIVDLALHTVADALAELLELHNGAEFLPFLTASSDHLRWMHLRRALPHLDEEALRALTGKDDRLFEDPFRPSVDAETLAAGPAEREATHDIPASAGAAPADASETSPSASVEAGINLTVRQTHAPPATTLADEDSTKRSLKIAGATGPTTKRSDPDPHRAKAAEDWTVLAEQAFERWPLLVAHLQGTRAFGCDVLSFETEADRDEFLGDPDQLHLIARFIETKSSTVRFTENEWSSACTFEDRYFVYRIQFTSPDRSHATLTIIRNPATQRAAIRMERELEIERVVHAELFELTPERLLRSDLSDSEMKEGR